MKLEPNSSVHLKMCPLIIFRIDTNRHILQTKYFPRNHSLTWFSSIFTFSSVLVFIFEYINDNQQHCITNIVRNYDGEVEKAVADFLASKLKEYWLKYICSLLKG